MVNRLNCARRLKHLDESTILQFSFVVKNVEICVDNSFLVSTLERLINKLLVQSCGPHHHVSAFDSRMEKLFNSFVPLSFKVGEVSFSDTCVRVVEQLLMKFEEFEHCFGRAD